MSPRSHRLPRTLVLAAAAFRVHRVLLAVALAVAITMTAGGVAMAQENNGEQAPPGQEIGARESAGISDSLDNVSPASLDDTAGTYWGRYPISRYGLDYKVTGVSADAVSEINPFDSGEGIDFSGIPALLAAMIVKLIWYACMYAAYAALALFQFAFNFNLLAGEDSVVGPIGGAIKAFDEAVGLEFLALTITIFGLWAMWRALVQRRYGEAVGGFAASGAVLLAALAFTFYAEEVVGFASTTLDNTAQEFLAIAGALAPEPPEEGEAGGTGELPEIDSEEQRALDALRDDPNPEVDGTLLATDALFKLLVYDSYTVLNFGGLEHCSSGTAVGGGEDTGALGDDESPLSRPVSQCPDRDGTMGDGSGGWDLVSNSYYANAYLSYNQGDGRRCCEDDPGSEYEAIALGDSGKRPDGDELDDLDPPPPAYERALGPEDAAAVDMQQAPTQFQRLGMTALTAFFVFGGVLLITGLSIAVIVSQLLFLLVLMFAPIIAVLSFIPKHGPEIGLGWLKRLAVLAAAKLYYSVLLALAVAVAFALLASADDLGWLMATGLTGLLFWILFFYRNRIQELITSGGMTLGSGAASGFGRLATAGAAYYGGRAVLRGAGAATRGTARGASAVGRQGVKTAMAPGASARAALDAPGRFQGMYRAGRERGMGVRRSASTAAAGSFDRQGAKARRIAGPGSKARGSGDDARKQVVGDRYKALRKEGLTPKEAHQRAKQDGDRYQSLSRQSEGHDRKALNKHLDRDQQYRPGAASGAGNGSAGSGRTGSGGAGSGRAGIDDRGPGAMPVRRSGASGPGAPGSEKTGFAAHAQAERDAAAKRASGERSSGQAARQKLNAGGVMDRQSGAQKAARRAKVDESKAGRAGKPSGFQAHARTEQKARDNSKANKKLKEHREKEKRRAKK